MDKDNFLISSDLIKEALKEKLEKLAMPLYLLADIELSGEDRNLAMIFRVLAEMGIVYKIPKNQQDLSSMLVELPDSNINEILNMLIPFSRQTLQIKIKTLLIKGYLSKITVPKERGCFTQPKYLVPEERLNFQQKMIFNSDYLLFLKETSKENNPKLLRLVLASLHEGWQLFVASDIISNHQLLIEDKKIDAASSAPNVANFLCITLQKQATTDQSKKYHSISDRVKHKNKSKYKLNGKDWAENFAKYQTQDADDIDKNSLSPQQVAQNFVESNFNWKSIPNAHQALIFKLLSEKAADLDKEHHLDIAEAFINACYGDKEIKNIHAYINRLIGLCREGLLLVKKHQEALKRNIREEKIRSELNEEERQKQIETIRRNKEKQKRDAELLARGAIYDEKTGWRFPKDKFPEISKMPLAVDDQKGNWIFPKKKDENIRN